MKIIELVIDEDAEQGGVDAISLVDEPAIETDFIALSKHRKFKQVKERQMLIGPALIPDKMIYRNDEERGDYSVYFSKKTVAKAMELYMGRGNNRSFTQDHEFKIEDVAVVESWIVEDTAMDKSKLYGFDVPKGTWMVAAKVNNLEVWAEFVKTGVVRGFSIEGYFMDRQLFSATPQQLQKSLDLASSGLHKVRKRLLNMEDDLDDMGEGAVARDINRELRRVQDDLDKLYYSVGQAEDETFAKQTSLLDEIEEAVKNHAKK